MSGFCKSGYICTITENHHDSCDILHKSLWPTINTLSINYTIANYTQENLHSTLKKWENSESLAQPMFWCLQCKE